MPRRAPAETPEDKVIREVEIEDEQFLDRAAREAGPPADARRLSERDEDDIYAIEDRRIGDVDAFAQQLATQGLSPEMAQQLMVVQARPDWLPMLTQPTGSLEAASQIAKAARFPWRWSLLEDIDDPDELVQKAEQLDRRYQRRVTSQQQYEADMQQPQPVMPETGGY